MLAPPLRFALIVAVATALATPAHAAGRAKAKRDPDANNLTIHVSVSHARILVDAREVAVDAPTELSIRVTPGRHELRIEHDGFEPFTGHVDVPESDAARVDALLHVAPPAAVAAPAPAPSAAPTPAVPIVKPTRVAVYELKPGSGVSALAAQLFTESLLAEVRKLDHCAAIGMSEIKDMLSFEQQKQLLGCDEKDECLTEIGGAIGVDELLTGNAGILGESAIVNLRRVDLGRAAVRGSVERRFKAGNGEEFLTAVGPAVQELFPEFPLKAGRERGVSPAVVARLNPPPLPRWVTITSGAAGVATVLAGGLFWSQYAAARDELAGYSGQEVQGTTIRTLQDRGQTAFDRSKLGFEVAAGIVLATGVAALFTDWSDLAAPAAGAGEDVAVGVGPAGISGRF